MQGNLTLSKQKAIAAGEIEKEKQEANKTSLTLADKIEIKHCKC
jgi:hypothetical protein